MNNLIAGLTDEVIDKLCEYAEMGLEEVELKHFNYAFGEVPEYPASKIAPVGAGFQAITGINAGSDCAKPEDCLKY